MQFSKIKKVFLKIKMAFTNAEYADMHFIYGLCNGNSRQARIEYIQRYPLRRKPCERVFPQIHTRLRENGTFAPANYRSGRQGNIPVDIETDIIAMVEEDPTISTRRIALRKNVSQFASWNILRKAQLYPYHGTPVQNLLERDKPLRLAFCNWMLNMEHDNFGFIKHILWTDEATFTRDGVTNFHNLHHWAEENPHKKKENNFQYRFKVNVWAGIFNNYLIGPHILPDNLNSQSYLRFLEDQLPVLLENIPLNLRAQVMFQQDGAPAHSGRIVTQFLNDKFNNRWIGRFGPHKWPPRSPDLTPLDFYAWGHLKDLVYAADIPTKEILIERIINCSQVVRQKLEEISIEEEVLKRINSCIDENGGHFEHL